MSGSFLSPIIIFIIFGENIAKQPWAQNNKKSSQQHLPTRSNFSLKKCWLTTGNQELETDKTTPIMSTQYFCFWTAKHFFIITTFMLWIFLTVWNTRLTQSQTEMLNPWHQNASSRINSQRPDPNSTPHPPNMSIDLQTELQLQSQCGLLNPWPWTGSIGVV